MAKGQKRSNRELKKPKQEKAAPKADTSFGSQVKAASVAPGNKGKSRPG
ncbi:hypothetical protein [Methylobrevis pamukkalensis]|uniref:Uncharacterized protein n=1 Tax=Methylobrevis pamukkalensis TaxID=1439726 RepID=A0A1E3H6M6_9HYPH|nr:hypothetical protein [Methylobrevis pamukkalensis]ODN71795.1 hypothetical protein A6302_00834 [Methylobrevis pamukkalensis]